MIWGVRHFNLVKKLYLTISSISLLSLGYLFRRPFRCDRGAYRYLVRLLVLINIWRSGNLIILHRLLLIIWHCGSIKFDHMKTSELLHGSLVCWKLSLSDQYSWRNVLCTKALDTICLVMNCNPILSFKIALSTLLIFLKSLLIFINLFKSVHLLATFTNMRICKHVHLNILKLLHLKIRHILNMLHVTSFSALPYIIIPLFDTSINDRNNYYKSNYRNCDSNNVLIVKTFRTSTAFILWNTSSFILMHVLIATLFIRRLILSILILIIHRFILFYNVRVGLQRS